MMILGRKNNNAPFPAGCLVTESAKYVAIDADVYPVNGDNTFLFWVQFSNSASTYVFYFREQDTSTDVSKIGLRPDLAGGRIYWTYGDTAARITEYAEANFDGSIKLIAIRHTASTGLAELFLDGELLDSFTATTSAIIDGYLLVGSSSITGTFKVVGPFIYSAALTNTQLSDVLTYGAAKLPTTNMTLGWPLCEETGTVAYDVSGNGNDGSVVGAPGRGDQSSLLYPRQKGYSKYTKSGSDDLYVPYGIDGTALTITPPSGYTKAFDAPA